MRDDGNKIPPKAFDMLGIPRNQIRCVTMPCFGTTDRTYDNACKMTRTLGAVLEEVDIKESVSLHFRDIKHAILLTVSLFLYLDNTYFFCPF